MAVWSRLTAAIAGLGVGEAAGAALEPVLDPLKQDAWAEKTPRVLELRELAELAARGLISRDAAHGEGARSGFSPERVDRAIQLVLEAAPVAELLELWRRGKIGEELVDHGLAKAAIEPQYWPAIKELFFARLSPAQVALGIVRSVIADPGLMPVDLNTSGGVVPRYPVSDIDPLLEAQAGGIDRERLRVMVGEIGLPMSPQQAASALFRQIIEHADYNRAILEGDTRPEWAAAILEQARQILTAREYVEGELRGFIDRNQRLAGTGKHGMSAADSDLLYNTVGRGVSVHQVVTGLARGGHFPSSYAQVPEPYRSALQRSNIRPEYADLAYANRYSYPSAFFFRLLLQDGALTAAEGEQRFLELGWPPDLAKLIADRLAGGSTATGKAETKAELADEYAGGFITQDEYRTALEALGYTGENLALELELGDARRTKAYREKVIEAIHTAYTEFEIDATEAASDLATVNVLGEAAAMLVSLWDLERRYTHARLSQAQVVKAYGKNLLAEADALTRLQEFGLSPADAAVRLAEG